MSAPNGSPPRPEDAGEAPLADLADLADGERGEAVRTRVPAAVVGILARLRRAGHAAWLVGESLHALLRGEPTSHFDVSTSAELAEVLALFERAVPTDTACARATVPTEAGPVDVGSLRNGPDVSDDLAHRDFTVHALAWRPDDAALLDPYGGAADLAEGRLRAVGDPHARLRESPLRLLRAARVVAEYGYAPDGALATAMREQADAVARIHPLRARRELQRLLLAPRADLGLVLLRRTQVEAKLVPGVRADAAAVAAAMPADLALRLAAWLRGTSAASVLQRWRFGLPVSQRATRLLGQHPIEDALRPLHGVALARFLRRLGEADVAALFALREAELAEAGRLRTVSDAELRRTRQELAGLRGGLRRASEHEDRERARRRLALDGNAVMAELGCGPGPRVGRALRHLSELVRSDPSQNHAETLRMHLERWAKEHPEHGGPG